jgi:SAM-dependent methyltransferase
MMASYQLTHCLCCTSNDLKLVLDLGSQPPANSYTSTAKDIVASFPLGLNICNQCWHAQLTFCVDRQEIFDRYAYVSGTSSTLGQFFNWYAKALVRVLPANARVLELAANDGSLIKEMQRAGLECIGVDPASNIVEKAREQGLPIVCGYWPEAAEDVPGKFDAIVCMNVVAHVDKPFEFLQCCKNKLAPKGIILVQPSQARMFENDEFDTIYHEHISFFNTSSITQLAARAGLKLSDAFMVKIHGDSPVYVLQHAEETDGITVHDAFSSGDFAISENLFSYEQRVNIYNNATYDHFRVNAQAIINGLISTVDDYLTKGFAVAFVGAAAKAMTIINAAGIKPTLFLDENPMKIGLHAPGCGSLIEPLNACKSLSQPTLFILSAWNFRHELTAKLRACGVPEGSVFYSYFPRPEIL